MSTATETRPPKYIEAVNRGIADALTEDERVVLLGIDVGESGGIFRTTRDLFAEFGPARVRDTPISEAGFVGAAVGAAMTGLRPIVEIMFMDFLAVCLDPVVNQAAKLRYMTGGAVEVPVVFRTQTGGGGGAGAQHSQSLEAMVAHVPGLRVVMPGTVSDAYHLLLAAVRDPNPVVYVENRRLYASRGPIEAEALPLGQARVARAGDDVTVVTWGQCVGQSLAAADAGEASLEVIDLRSLVPLDIETVVASAARTGRVLVVHEAVQDFGAGAEIAAQVSERLFGVLRAPVRRLAAPFAPSPFSPVLERELLPNAERIAAAAAALAREDRRTPREPVAFPAPVSVTETQPSS